jgi:hypothetical protein
MRIAEGAEKRQGDRSRYLMVAVFMVAVFMVAVFLVAVVLVQGITDRWDVSNSTYWVCFPMVIGPVEHDWDV